MDMVAEAKKRVEKRWGMDYDEDGQSFFLVQEGFVYALIEREYPNDEVDADFIAEAPRFIVAQDERIKQLEKAVEASKVFVNGYFLFKSDSEMDTLAWDLERAIKELEA